MPQEKKNSTNHFIFAYGWVIATGLSAYWNCYPLVIVFGLLSIGSFITSAAENLKEK